MLKSTIVKKQKQINDQDLEDLQVELPESIMVKIKKQKVKINKKLKARLEQYYEN